MTEAAHPEGAIPTLIATTWARRKSAKHQKKRPPERAQSGGERKTDQAVRERQRFVFARAFAFVLRTTRFALRARVDFAAGRATGPRFTTFV